MKVNTYLNFLGNTEEAFNFYRAAFGGEFKTIVRFKDMDPEGKMPDEDRDKVMHIALELGNGDLLMGTDALESFGHKISFGNNFYIMLEVSSEAEADEIFNKLSEGGKIEQPLAPAPWGAYFGSFADKFGVQWMVDYTYLQA
jgi:PhnB protein